MLAEVSKTGLVSEAQKAGQISYVTVASEPLLYARDTDLPRPPERAPTSNSVSHDYRLDTWRALHTPLQVVSDRQHLFYV